MIRNETYQEVGVNTMFRWAGQVVFGNGNIPVDPWKHEQGKIEEPGVFLQEVKERFPALDLFLNRP